MKFTVQFGWSIVLLLAPAALPANDQIPWVADFQSACGMAAEQHRLVLLHFYNDNCGPCVRLEQNVFNKPAVAEAVAQNYLAVKVHAGKNKQLASRYRIQQWPTDVFVTPSGLEVFRTVSPQKPEEYIAVLNQVAQQTGVGASRQWKAQMAQTLPDHQKIGNKGQAAADRQQSKPQQGGEAKPGTQYSAFGAGSNTTASNTPKSTEVATAAFSQDAPAEPKNVANDAAPTGHGLSDQLHQATESVLDRRSAFVPSEPSPATPAATPGVATTPASAPLAPTSVPPPAVTNNPWIASATPAAAAPAAPSPAAVASQPAAEVNQPAPATTASGVAAFVSAAAAQAQPAPEFPNHQMVPRHEAPPIALDGFCPVTLMEAMAQNRVDRSAWRKGDEKFGAIHEGRTYLFTSPESQKKFLDNPALYAPLLSGCDPVLFAERGQMIPGKRCYGLLTADRHMYLFADEASFNRFKQAPSNYAAAVQQALARNQTTSIYR